MCVKSLSCLLHDSATRSNITLFIENDIELPYHAIHPNLLIVFAEISGLDLASPLQHFGSILPEMVAFSLRCPNIVLKIGHNKNAKHDALIYNHACNNLLRFKMIKLGITEMCLTKFPVNICKGKKSFVKNMIQ